MNNNMPYHDNYSSGAPVPAMLRILGFAAKHVTRVTVAKVSNASSRSIFHVL